MQETCVIVVAQSDSGKAACLFQPALCVKHFILMLRITQLNLTHEATGKSVCLHKIVHTVTLGQQHPLPTYTLCQSACLTFWSLQLVETRVLPG